MILFFATLGTMPKLLARLDKPNVLTSYVDRWQPTREQVSLLFLDSGAFTAYNTGKEVSLSAYIDFCLEHRQEYDLIAALDVIGDPEASARNYRTMRAAGLDVVPTYHLGDDWRYFEALLAEYATIAIGGVAFRVTKGKGSVSPFLRHLIRCHQLAQQAGVRLHGFGITWWDLIASLPWYSIDSSSFNQGARFGALQVWQGGRLVRRICRAPSEGGVRLARAKLQKYLRVIPYRQPYSVEDLFPFDDTPEAALARCHFNCLAFLFAIEQISRQQAAVVPA